MEESKVIWVYGAPGMGKTARAEQMYGRVYNMHEKFDRRCVEQSDYQLFVLDNVNSPVYFFTFFGWLTE